MFHIKFYKRLTLISTTVMFALTQTFAFAQDNKLNITGSTTVFPTVKDFQIKLRGTFEGSTIVVEGGGSGAGAKCAKAGTCDIGMSSRELKPEESADMTVVKIGEDGLVFVVNTKNTLDNISTEQVTNIFKQETKEWAKVGVSSVTEPMNVITRSKEAGETELFKNHFKFEAQGTSIISPNSDVVLSVSKENNSISFMSFGVAEKNKAKGIKILKLDGVDATEKNITDGKYKVKRSLFLIYNPKSPKKDLIEKFIIEYKKIRSEIFPNYDFIISD